MSEAAAIPLASLRVGSNPFALEEAPGQSEVSSITIEVVPTDGLMAYLKQTYGQ
jgi:hypothetical protein